MKQPELGQKLIELRKDKDLTQEELVEACNVSIRTIQRIEAGEVTPRTSTIKIILAALGEDLSVFKEATDRMQNNAQLARSAHWLQLAWIFGIVYFIVGFIEIGMDAARYDAIIGSFYDYTNNSYSNNTVYIFIKLISFGSYAIFLWGFWHLAVLFKVDLLKVSVYLMIIISLIISLLDIFVAFIEIDEDWMIPLMIVETISLGAVAIVLGLGLMKLQDGMGRLAFGVGILEVIIGFFLVTVVLFLISAVLMIPTIIMEIVLLYRGYEYAKNNAVGGSF
ncbi:MAG: helix-turn-helix transcriptional regulator [Cytophagales bacterium]|nr:helix-turn-helix transcriptional regulator [Cytophagales bacterium]